MNVAAGPRGQPCILVHTANQSGRSAPSPANVGGSVCFKHPCSDPKLEERHSLVCGRGKPPAAGGASEDAEQVREHRSHGCGQSGTLPGQRAPRSGGCSDAAHLERKSRGKTWRLPLAGIRGVSCARFLCNDQRKICVPQRNDRVRGPSGSMIAAAFGDLRLGFGGRKCNEIR